MTHAMKGTLWAAAVGLVLTAGPGLAEARSTLKVGSMTVNGLTLKNLKCTLDRSGFLVAMTVVGTLAKRKKSFHRCARKGAAFAVEFQWAGRRTRRAKVKYAVGSRAKKCVRKALLRLRPALTGRCTAILLTGKKKASQAAAVKLIQKLKKLRKRLQKTPSKGRKK
jgi:hypothetical protein